MNVLYYLHSYPPASFVLNELYELDRRGHTVVVFAATGAGGITHSEASHLDIPVRINGVPSKTALPGVVTELLRSGTVPTSRASARREVLKRDCLRNCHDFVSGLPVDIDHVHVHFPSDLLAPARSIADRLGVPCTGTAHAFELFVRENARENRHVLDSMDRLLVPCEYNRRFLRDELDMRGPIDSVPAPLRLEKFEPSGRTRQTRLLTVSRHVKKKGILTAIRSVARLDGEYPELEYHVVGDGPERDRIEREVKSHGLGDVVSIRGRLPDEELIREFDEAAVFLLPCQVDGDGDRDALPVVLKEAMAMRAACVSTYVSAVPELIADGQNGLLVPERDERALAAELRRVIDDDALRSRLVSAGRETVEGRHDAKATVEDLLASFRAAN
jgi:glycosyltransferase involved in cell wall biosynthesis